MGRTIGIDLGTTNSAAAVLKDGKVRLVPAAEGPTLYGKMFPSVVAFKEDGEIVVGKRAKSYAYIRPDRTVRWIKRKMGTNHTIPIDGHRYTPQEISAMIVKKIVGDAEEFLGEKIDKAVLSAPAYFNNNQRHATKEAGEMAGLEVLRILSEPTAASLAYGLDKIAKNLKIAVLDLGAGTFDVTILQSSGSILKVISTSGDTRLGGKDMDDAILDFLVDAVEEKLGVGLRADEKNLNKLRDAGEMAKIHLSTRDSTIISPQLNVEGLKMKPHITLTRCRLEELIEPQLKGLRSPLEQALEDSGLETQDIGRLVLVGGPTRMPIVRRHFRCFFGMEPEKGIDPMGSVAVGASIQASVLKGEMRELLLTDVTPLSLGVETSGGVFTRLIKRNTTIPTERSMIFATEEDGQSSMMIHVLQGEREMANDNTSLGLFKLDGIPPAPRYEQEVQVTFQIDANGLLKVSAEILATGKGEVVKLTRSTELTKDDLTRIIIEATRFDEIDEERKKIAEIFNEAKAVIHAEEREIRDIGGRIPERERKKIEGTLAKLRKALGVSDAWQCRRYTAELLELVKGADLKAKRMAQAKMLLASLEKSSADKMSEKERRRVQRAVARIQAATCEDIMSEMSKLKEAIILAEAEHEGDEAATNKG